MLGVVVVLVELLVVVVAPGVAATAAELSVLALEEAPAAGAEVAEGFAPAAALEEESSANAGAATNAATKPIRTTFRIFDILQSPLSIYDKVNNKYCACRYQRRDIVHYLI